MGFPLGCRKWVRRHAVPFGLVALLAMPGWAWGQTPNIPGAAEPGRIQRQFQPPPGPAPTPEVISPEIPEAAPPGEAARIRFTLNQIVVDGSTVYSPDQLKALYGDYLGREVSLVDVYRIADTITAKYRSDGYILSRAVVPAQRISGGIVHITIVEGFINRVIIQGTETAAVRSYADRLTRSRPLKSEDLQRYLLLMNDLPGIQARSVLEPAKGVTGGSDLTIIVESKRTDASVSLDNHGSKFVGPIELLSQAAINDPTGSSDQLVFHYVTTPVVEEELRYFALDYGTPIGTDGLKLLLSGTGNTSVPGGTLQTPFLRTETNGETGTGRLSYPLVRSRAENLYVDLSFTYSNLFLDQFALPSNTRLVSSYADHLRVLRAGTNYDTLDDWEGRDFVRFELSRGLPIFGATAGGQATGVSRPGGRSQFWKATLDAARLQSLNAITPGLGLLTAASGLASFGQQLLASEQFGVGGTQFGRGYDPSELLGDYGAAGKAELQYTFSGIQLFQQQPTVQAYTFVDYGRLSDANARALGNPAGPRALASAGAGLRVSIATSLSADLQLAQPLTRDPTEFVGGAKPLRGYFALTATF